MAWRLRSLLAFLVVTVMGGTAFVLFRPSVRQESRDSVQLPTSNEPAMCPWRNPDSDIRALFPGATGFRTELFTLSRYRVELLRRFGAGSRIESHSLHAYRILHGSNAVGAIMVRRFSAPHGAMEVVIGVDPEGRTVGVRVQRQREPPGISRPITSPIWLAAFVGKTAESSFRLGAEIPDVPAEAREAAKSLIAAVRTRLIEFSVGAKIPGQSHH
jgi:hypothetical protein